MSGKAEYLLAIGHVAKMSKLFEVTFSIKTLTYMYGPKSTLSAQLLSFHLLEFSNEGGLHVH